MGGHLQWLGWAPPRWQDSAWGSLSVMTVVLTVANISQTLTCIHSFDLHTTLQVDILVSHDEDKETEAQRAW